MSDSRYTLVFEAIHQILSESSVGNLTISNIAKKCHLHPNTVNYYFKGKADMLMRFHAYLIRLEALKRPEYYHTVPPDEHEAVRALASILDQELFNPYFYTEAQKKLQMHLFSSMDEHPVIRQYLAEKHSEHQSFLRQVAILYQEAGIIKAEALEEGMSSLMVCSAGLEYLHFYYEAQPLAHMSHTWADLTGNRSKLLRMLVQDKYLVLLNDILGELH